MKLKMDRPTPTMLGYIKRMKQGQSVRQSSITFSVWINSEKFPLNIFSGIEKRGLVKRNKEMVGTDYIIQLTELGKSLIV